MAPFKNLDLSELERSKDVSMLMDIINILPYKLSCYKYIVNDLYKDGGMDDYHDYGRDTWDALTDGMYGDYPGSGVDYDFLGFD